MDHSGTPVAFKMDRSLGKKSLGTDHTLGVFVSSFKDREGDEKARVFSPKDGKIHTCKMENLLCLDDRPFKTDSLVTLEWQAIAKTIAITLKISDEFTVVSRIDPTNMSKLVHLLNIDPKDWPKVDSTKGETMIGALTRLGFKPCVCHLTGAGGIYKNGFVIIGLFQGASINRTTNRPGDKGCVWLLFDPKVKEQVWQFTARKKIEQCMEKFQERKEMIGRLHSEMSRGF